MHTHHRKCGVNSWNSSLSREIKLTIGKNSMDYGTFNKTVRGNKGPCHHHRGNSAIGLMLNAGHGDRTVYLC